MDKIMIPLLLTQLDRNVFFFCVNEYQKTFIFSLFHLHAPLYTWFLSLNLLVTKYLPKFRQFLSSFGLFWEIKIGTINYYLFFYAKAKRSTFLFFLPRQYFFSSKSRILVDSSANGGRSPGRSIDFHKFCVILWFFSNRCWIALGTNHSICAKTTFCCIVRKHSKKNAVIGPFYDTHRAREREVIAIP